MVIIEKDGLRITFIKRLKKPLLYVYRVEVENLTNSDIPYDMSEITSPYGTNALELGQNPKTIGLDINEHRFLTSDILGKKDKQKGIVAFVKNEIACNAPKIEFRGIIVKLNFEKRKVK